MKQESGGTEAKLAFKMQGVDNPRKAEREEMRENKGIKTYTGQDSLNFAALASR